ncbi:N-acetyltransferase [Streptomyces sp. AJS327]|uniref:GNAT family N-acetyltransferase n=1 Tax=Streptomyces sp. AJS327 TaxID=2545265 RepID=UPI0015DD5C6F|nr:GNAT family N-acetyltransferase [Streptomyces sp. AJS327]MBA0050534.1 N-acetyltransferase [Streptomyces sp. AJS327]
MTAPAPLYTRHDPGLGEFALRALQPLDDAELLHRWVTHPKSAFYLLGDATPEQVRQEFTSIANSPHHDAFLGLHRGRPAFLMERYDPAHVELTGLYDHQPGDVGMHFLCAPTDTPLRGFSLAVITTVVEMLFADETTRRIVVEPDVRNTAVHALNEAVGFRVERTLTKPEKEAALSFCTREEFQAARSRTAPGDSDTTGSRIPEGPAL